MIYSAIPCNQCLTTLNKHLVLTPEQRRRHSHAQPQESNGVAAMLKHGRNKILTPYTQLENAIHSREDASSARLPRGGESVCVGIAQKKV